MSRLPVETWLSASELSCLPHRLAVGWSGGADSTALLLALKQAGYQVEAWHVDHGWRESSVMEAEELAGKAEQWGIPFLAAGVRQKLQGNREAEARRLRYAQFQQWGREREIDTLCLAHHLDDQVETVLMRLLQGAGPGGCRGMGRKRRMGALKLVRPLLHVPGADLKAALSDAGIDWLEDPSNRDTAIRRNHLRHRLLPAITAHGVDAADLFMRWQHQAERLSDQLDAEVDAVFRQCSGSASEGFTICWRDWKTSQPAVRARMLQRAMAEMLGEGATPGRRHIELVELWTGKSGRGGLDLSRCRLYRESDRLHLRPAKAALA